MNGDITGYRDLVVWQKAMSLVEDVYRLTGNFPSAERFGLTSQIQRSAISIPCNIAEDRVISQKDTEGAAGITAIIL